MFMVKKWRELREAMERGVYPASFVFIELFLNLGSVLLVTIVLFLSRNETPTVPLRLWMCVYALQCAIISVFLSMSHLRRLYVESCAWIYDDASGQQHVEHHTSALKHVVYANTILLYIWWIVGSYVIYAGGVDSISNAPLLSGLCLFFLVFDGSWLFPCSILACVFVVAVSICLLFFIGGEGGAALEGASEEEHID